MKSILKNSKQKFERSLEESVSFTVNWGGGVLLNGCVKRFVFPARVMGAVVERCGSQTLLQIGITFFVF